MDRDELFNPYLPERYYHIEKEFNGIGYKAVGWLNFNQRQFNSSAIKKHKFHLISHAVCLKNRSHVSPSYDCECGFYALKSLELATSYIKYKRNLVLVEVSIYGKFIEHEMGYRYQEQEIRKIILPDICSKRGCENNSIYLINSLSSVKTRCFSHKGSKSAYRISDVDNIAVGLHAYKI